LRSKDDAAFYRSAPRGSRRIWHERVGRLALSMAALLCALAPAGALGGPASWWDADYGFRRQITLSTGPNDPDKGYAGYTARIPAFDTGALVAAGKLQADCDDLRVVRFDGASWSEVDRHVLGCDATATDIRFMLQADIAPSSSDTSYFLYYGNPSAGAPAPLGTGNVYLWYDDATVDRSGSYVRGRVDPWHGSGWDDSLVWNPAGYYVYDNGDNFTSGYRRALDERDVYVEAEFFHTGCYPVNMTSGVLVRGIVDSGSGGSEQSDHYYASNRGHQDACGSGYAEDGDIFETDRTVAAVDGPNPPAIAVGQWRKQALAAWQVNPTELKFWDADAGWAAPGWPGAGELLASGSDADDYEGRGFVALMTAQDQARVRNMLVRRYVEPEPTLSVGAEEVDAGSFKMESDRVTLNDTFAQTTFTSVSFRQTYDTPPLVFAVATDSGGDPSALRVRSVTTTGFEVSQVEPPGNDGPHVAMSVHYFAIEPGVHVLPDGTQIEAGTHTTTSVQRGPGVGGPPAWDALAFGGSYSGTPAVVAQVQGMANESGNPPATHSEPWLVTAIRNASASGMEVALERAEVDDGSVSSPETIAYVAIEGDVQGSFSANGNTILYESIVSGDTIRGWDNGCFTVNFSNTYGGPPLVMATQTSRDGNNGGWLRRCSLSASAVGLTVDEDIDRDSERSHTTEQAGLLVFSEPFHFPDDVNLDHFDIDHDGNAIHCIVEPVTVTAEDDGGATVAGYTGTITLDTQSGRGTWTLASGSGTFTDATPDDGRATYTFDAADDGVAAFDLEYREGASPIDIEVTDGTQSDDDTEGPLAFSPSGFTVTPNDIGNPPGAITPIPSQTAGGAFDLHITAFGQTPSDPTCGVIESYEGTKPLKFWSTYSNPGAGGVAVAVDGNPIAATEAGAAAQAVTFVQGQAAVGAKYKDVGEIRIEMKDDTTSDPQLPGGIRGGTNLFVVKPADFVLSDIARTADGFPNPGAGDANGPVFVRAGEAFSVTVEARDAEGDPTPNYGRETPAEGVRLSPTLVAAGDANNPPVTFGTGFGSFSAGRATGTDFSWGEVGIITLTPSVADADYLGAGDVTGTASGNVGRFIPFDFAVSTNTPVLDTACAGGGFTYAGQPFGYATQPVLTVTARNRAGGTTQNYTGAWWKITDAKLAAGGDKTYAAATGTLDTSLVPSPDPVIADTGGGSGTLTFSAGAGIGFVRGAPTAPFEAEISLSINVLDEDDVAYAGNPARFGDASPGNGIAFDNGKTFRWGRIGMQNAHGSELLALEVPTRAEYYDGAGFATHTDDACSALAAGDLVLANDQESGQRDGDIAVGGGSSSADIAQSPMSGGDAGLSFSAPGEGNTGYVDVTVDLSTASGADLAWLRYDWDGDGAHDDDPAARASFGIFGGAGVVIHVREPWN